MTRPVSDYVPFWRRWFPVHKAAPTRPEQVDPIPMIAAWTDMPETQHACFARLVLGWSWEEAALNAAFLRKVPLTDDVMRCMATGWYCDEEAA